MHIPLCPISEVEVLPFNDALELSRRENGEYDVNKWIYVPPVYGEYRYILGTRGENPLIAIGINPSTACPDNLDNTLKSVCRTAQFNGYDSFIMFNVYAQRATNPEDMDEDFNAYLHRENLEAFRYILSGVKNARPAVWAAWGTIVEKRQYLFGCMRDFVLAGEEYNAEWFTVGKRSKAGHPHHPLYLKNGLPVELFDVNSYLDAHRL